MYGNAYLKDAPPRSNGSGRTLLSSPSEEKQLSRRERWKALGDWTLHGVIRKNWSHESIAKVANTGATGATGGYLIPTFLMVGVDALVQELSFFHQFAAFQPMLARNMFYPTVDPAAAASGASPLLGGFQMYWANEGSTVTNGNALFATVELVAKDLGGVGYASNQFMDDGGEPLGAYLENLFAKAVSFYVTKACFNGTGIGQPQGLIGGPGTVTVSRSVALDIIEVDVENLFQKLLPACYPYAWLACSPAAFARLTSVSGYNPVSPVSVNGQMRGRPIHVTEVLPTLGTTGDVVLFDPRLYVLGEKLGIEVAYAPEEPTAYTRYQTAFRVWWRGDGQQLFRSTATLANTEATASPYVVLETKLS